MQLRRTERNGVLLAFCCFPCAKSEKMVAGYGPWMCVGVQLFCAFVFRREPEKKFGLVMYTAIGRIRRQERRPGSSLKDKTAA